MESKIENLVKIFTVPNAECVWAVDPKYDRCKRKPLLNSNPFPSSKKKKATVTATTQDSLLFSQHGSPLFPQHNISVLCLTLSLSLNQQSSIMYSASTIKSVYKPPLPRSPIRLRPSHAAHSSNSIALQTPPGSFFFFKP